MATIRVVACAIVLALVLVPLVGVATDDLSVAGTHHDNSVRHQPARAWRTVPAAVDRPEHDTCTVVLARLDVPEPAPIPPPLARPLFVPPRG
jgi:hypothetical protein